MLELVFALSRGTEITNIDKVLYRVIYLIGEPRKN